MPARTDHQRAFLEWVEDGDGATRTWGELVINQGARTYDLRHVADRDADPADLDSLDGPRDLRDRARFTDDGDFRPLKTAPTLPTGWHLSGLDADEFLRAVEFVYPATMANWHLEREGELDVTHFRATADRQTGIYERVAELDRDAVENAAVACCADSQCLKRREWDYDEDEPLDAPRGDGEFPCREPCSLFVASGREFAGVEREDERTYELDLTPDEFEQLEAILDAMAEGRTDEIRDAEADDPANRFRVRYLRAKLFGDDSHEAVTGGHS